MAKRSRRELLLAILDACMERRIITHVMYQTGINYTLLEELLAGLLGKGLLTKTVIRKREFFKTTASGYAVLSQWCQLNCALGA